MSSTSPTFLQERFLGLDRFVIERQLGEGSMGAVYLAYDRARDARVALKTLRRVDASGIYRFKREFRALADVSHPNLVALHELFAEGTEWFFTMEYVEGKGFLDYVLGEAALDAADFVITGSRDRDPAARGTRELSLRRSGARKGLSALFPSPLRDVDKLRSVLAQITEAIMAVHAVGKLHRDLKPDNVLVTDAERAVVLDFGIAIERVEDVNNHTLEVGVMGTPAYMSPEQAAGGEVDEATDWYALGVMLFEALTGSVPFSGTYLEVMRQKQEVDPQPPSELVSGVPEDLDALCAQLLSRDAARRPRGAQILEVLRGRDTGEHARPSKPAEDTGPVFIGRGTEQKELERALLATDDGAPIVCFLQGASGMGKSALADRFLSQLREANRAVVLAGRCYERETVPFKAWDSVIDALCRYLGRLPLYAAAEIMPKDIEALAHIFPVLKRVEIVNRVKRRSKLPSDPRELRRRAFIALKELFGRIAQREPLVVYIDDLQWGDLESARLIAELITGSDRPPLLFLGSYRSGDIESSPCLQALFEHTRDNKQTDIRQITVHALSDAESLSLARKLLGQDSTVDAAAVARESRGNPYLLSELVHHLKNTQDVLGGSRHTQRVSLEHALSDRLSSVSHGAFAVLELVAVAGRPVHEEILASLTPGDVDLHEALTELRRAKLVRGVGSARARAIDLYHDGIREAVLARLSHSLVKHWHKRLADALEAHGTTDLHALTTHLLGAEDFSRASIYAIRAASAANRALAFEQAAELYAIAVKHHEDEAWRHELMLQWAEALVNARRGTQAAEVYLEAASKAPAEDVAELESKAGVQLLLSGEFDRGIKVLAATLDALQVSMPQTVEEALAVSSAYRHKTETEEISFMVRRAADIPPEALERLDKLWSITMAVLLSRPLLAHPLIIRYLTEALEVGDARHITPGLCCYFMNVDLEAATREGGRKPRSLQLAEQLGRESADSYGRAWIALAQGFSFQNIGLLKPAILQITQAEELFRNHTQASTAEVRICRQLSSWLSMMLGGFEDLPRVEQWMREAEERGDHLGALRLRCIAVFAALAVDDVDKAQARLAQVTPQEQADTYDVLALLAPIARSQLHLYQGDADACLATLPVLDAAFRSPLIAVHMWRGQLLAQRARTALLASTTQNTQNTQDAQDALQAQSALQIAERDLHELEKLGLPHFADHTRLLHAAIAFGRGQLATAVDALDAILKDAEETGDGPVVLAVARACKARCLPEPEATRWLDEGYAAMRARSIENPAAFLRLYAPGFVPDDGDAARTTEFPSTPRA